MCHTVVVVLGMVQLGGVRSRVVHWVARCVMGCKLICMPLFWRKTVKRVVTAIALAAVSGAGVASGDFHTNVWVLECEYTHILTVEDGLQPIRDELINSGQNMVRFERVDDTDILYQVYIDTRFDEPEYIRRAVSVERDGDILQMLRWGVLDLMLISVAGDGQVVATKHREVSNDQVRTEQLHGQCQESRVHSTPHHPYTINTWN